MIYTSILVPAGLMIGFGLVAALTILAAGRVESTAAALAMQFLGMVLVFVAGLGMLGVAIILGWPTWAGLSAVVTAMCLPIVIPLGIEELRQRELRRKMPGQISESGE